MTKLDMLTTIKDYLERYKNILKSDLDLEELDFKTVKYIYSFLEVKLKLLLEKYEEVEKLVSPNIWQNYKDFDMMEEEDIYEIREMNAIVRLIEKENRYSPLTMKGLKKCQKKQLEESKKTKKRQRALSKLLSV